MKPRELTDRMKAALDGAGRLPLEFLSAMEPLLGDEFEAFLHSYDEKCSRGLCFNMSKARPETVAKLCREWSLEPVAWCREGFSYDEELIRPGKSPYHDAGVFYLQEPSAMSAVPAAEIEEGDLVLDLCAAPGGKSVQAAGRARLVVANEIVPKRARILSSNIERMGLSNVIVSSASPDELAEALPGVFDRIIVDAPCSGEGMFRKDQTAIEEWSLENVQRCVERQRDILEAALRLLRPGGRIVYSTCTFEPAENEWQARRFCHLHGDELRLSDWRQLFPHRGEGEGLFYAVMDSLSGPGTQEFRAQAPKLDELAVRLRRAGIHVLRAGIEPGVLKKGNHRGEERYEHSHAQAMKAGEPVIGPYAELCSEELALRYISGESLRLCELSEGELRLCAKEGDELRVLFDGYPLGLGKYASGAIKNKLPKGLRRV